MLHTGMSVCQLMLDSNLDLREQSTEGDLYAG